MADLFIGIVYRVMLLAVLTAVFRKLSIIKKDEVVLTAKNRASIIAIVIGCYWYAETAELSIWYFFGIILIDLLKLIQLYFVTSGDRKAIIQSKEWTFFPKKKKA